MTRRDFSLAALSALPLSLRAAAAGSVQIGVASESFHDLPRTPGHDNVDAVIAALKGCGATCTDLASFDTEAPNPELGLPPLPPPGPYGGAPAGLTPAEIAVRTKALRDNLRKWRLATPPAHYAALKRKFDAAGISIYSLSFDHDEAFTDEELNATFLHAKALGAEVITSRTTLPMAKRLAPFADRHTAVVAFRNEPGHLETASELGAALALSPRFQLNLNLGNFTAANQEALAFVQENHRRITHFTLSDRTRNGGGNEAFGEGDTPLKPVLAWLHSKRLPVRAFIDFEYAGLGTPEQEIRKCLAWTRAALG